jgi:CRP/FNR family transcriptional regulator, cyclic AMP receptor protein
MVGSTVKPSVAMLKNITLLQSFSESELSQLISMGDGTSCEAHASIIIEGEMSFGLHLILHGTVGVFKTNKLTGDFYDVAQLRAGTFFGEMSLVDSNPRSATVRALTDCQLFFISKDAFHKFISQSQTVKFKFYENCISTLVSRLRELDDNYVISQYQLWKNTLKKEAA